MSTKTLKFYETTIGKKIVMALSGAVLLGFVLSHMAGNLLIFANDNGAALNAYAASLRELLGGFGIWVARLVLVGAIAGHVWSAVQLARINRGARKQRYRRQASLASTMASRSMLFGGLAILFYIIFHLVHLTFGAVPNTMVAMEGVSILEHDVYQSLIKSFKQTWIAAIYLVAQVFLALHLYHGAWSFMQTLGLSHPRYDAYRKQFAGAFAAVVCLGFAVVPIAVLAEWVK